MTYVQVSIEKVAYCTPSVVNMHFNICSEQTSVCTVTEYILVTVMLCLWHEVIFHAHGSCKQGGPRYAVEDVGLIRQVNQGILFCTPIDKFEVFHFTGYVVLCHFGFCSCSVFQ
jgi:hypothetical protein